MQGVHGKRPRLSASGASVVAGGERGVPTAAREQLGGVPGSTTRRRPRGSSKARVPRSRARSRRCRAGRGCWPSARSSSAAPSASRCAVGSSNTRAPRRRQNRAPTRFGAVARRTPPPPPRRGWCRGRGGASPTHSPSPTRSNAPTISSSVASALPMATFWRRDVVKRCASWPTGGRRPHVGLTRRAEVDAPERDRAGRSGPRSARARGPASSCLRRWPRRCRPRRRERPRPTRHGARAWWRWAEPTVTCGDEHAVAGSSTGAGGSVTAACARTISSDAPRGARAGGEPSRRLGEAGRGFEGAERDQQRGRQQVPSSRPPAVASTPIAEHADDVSPCADRAERRRRPPVFARRAPGGRAGRRRRHGRGRRRRPRGRRPRAPPLRASARRARRRAARAPGLAQPVRRVSAPWRRAPRARRRPCRAGGRAPRPEHHEQEAGGAERDHGRDERRGQRAQVEVLQRLDVATKRLSASPGRTSEPGTSGASRS